jgi:uracil-DNA glycosylase family 4
MMELSPIAHTEPPVDCLLCPRLVALRRECQSRHPGWWNAPVPAFGDANAWLGIVGLAPGMHGANRTGRPFTGDYAGDLLFATFAKFGLSRGTYQSRVDDGLELEGVIIINSVKCLPPQNKPTPQEINTCRRFLSAQLDALPQLRVFIALGRIAHDSFLRHLGLRAASHPFGHNALHDLGDGRVLIDSYHCSRYNINTGRLTEAMFEAVFERALAARNRITPAG